MIPEYEVSLGVPVGNLATLKEEILSTPLLELKGGDILRREGADRRIVMHLYVAGTAGLFKDRIKVWRSGQNRLTGRHNQKFYEGKTKFEGDVDHLLGANAIAARLRSVESVRCALVKHQARWRYASHSTQREHQLKISIDCMFAVELQTCQIGEPFIHMEIEATMPGVVERLIEGKWFTTAIEPHTHPLRASDTKWRVATRRFPTIYSTEGLTASSLRTKLGVVEGQVRSHVLARDY